MSDIYQVIKSRHSVRSYTDKRIEGSIKEELEKVIEQCNKEGELNIKLILNEPKAFDTFIAHYGKLNNVKNYVAMIGKKSKNLEEKCGYYGEKIVLKAQELGLNTCWVGMTYSKKKVPYELKNNEEIVIVIAIGYGVTDGKAHKIKRFQEVSVNKENDVPDWYKTGVEYALLAPTAVNQQRFKFKLDKNYVKATAGPGFFSQVDLGIVKYHFELGAGKENFKWM